MELQAQILALLPDIGTLRTAVLSCPAFFHAFRYSEGPIMNSVLLGEIGSAVFPEAVIALEASSIRHGKPTVQERANSVSQKQLLRREQVQWIWTPADALAASKVHFYVHSFATKFASAALSRVPSCSGLQLEHSPSTQQELERIERALYRFEIYCNLFPPSRSMESEIASGDSAAMQYEAFFSRFAPWENEQLACIYDFLVREVSPGRVEVLSREDDFADHVQRLIILRSTTLRGVSLVSNTRTRSMTITFKDFLPTVCEDFMTLPPQIRTKLATSCLDVLSRKVSNHFYMSRFWIALTKSTTPLDQRNTRRSGNSLGFFGPSSMIPMQAQRQPGDGRTGGISPQILSIRKVLGHSERGVTFFGT